jgi:hypothetical protein
MVCVDCDSLLYGVESVCCLCWCKERDGFHDGAEGGRACGARTKQEASKDGETRWGENEATAVRRVLDWCAPESDGIIDMVVSWHRAVFKTLRVYANNELCCLRIGRLSGILLSLYDRFPSTKNKFWSAIVCNSLCILISLQYLHYSMPS